MDEKLKTILKTRLTCLRSSVPLLPVGLSTAWMTRLMRMLRLPGNKKLEKTASAEKDEAKVYAWGRSQKALEGRMN